MNVTFVLLLLALAGYILTCFYQWRRLERGEPTDRPGKPG